MLNFFGLLYVEIDCYTGGQLQLNLYLKFLTFKPDDEHIKWLCQTHEWLRPYFPFWNGVF